MKETLDSMSEENFDLMLQESDEETLWGIVAIMSEENLDEKGLLRKIGGAALGGVAKVAKRYGTTAGRAGGAEKKLAKMKTKQKDKARLAKAKAGIKKLKQKSLMIKIINLKLLLEKEDGRPHKMQDFTKFLLLKLKQMT